MHVGVHHAEAGYPVPGAAAEPVARPGALENVADASAPH